MANTINEYFQPASTGVHSNIDNLILQAELDKLAQTGSMRADTRPQYIGGVDPIVENIALSPLLTLKSLGSVGKKLLEKTGLRNPVSHYTRGQSAKDILEAGAIKGAEESFPGKPFYRDSRKYLDKQLDKDKTGFLSETDIKFQEQFPKSPSVSITRDPMFSSRPHKHVGTDIRFVMDRDDLIKKGFKIEPFTEPNYGKTSSRRNKYDFNYDIYGKYPSQMNPRFEFEERVRGYIPTENIKLIDILQLPLGESDFSPNMLKLLGQLSRTNIPIIKSSLVKNRLSRIPIGRAGNFEDIYKIMETPTYKFDPFEKVR